MGGISGLSGRRGWGDAVRAECGGDSVSRRTDGSCRSFRDAGCHDGEHAAADNNGRSGAGNQSLEIFRLGFRLFDDRFLVFPDELTPNYVTVFLCLIESHEHFDVIRIKLVFHGCECRRRDFPGVRFRVGVVRFICLRDFLLHEIGQCHLSGKHGDLLRAQPLGGVRLVHVKNIVKGVFCRLRIHFVQCDFVLGGGGVAGDRGVDRVV